MQVSSHQIEPFRLPVRLAPHPRHFPGVRTLSPPLQSLEHHSPALLELVKRTAPKTAPHLSQASFAETLRSMSSFLTCSRLSFTAFSSPVPGCRASPPGVRIQ